MDGSATVSLVTEFFDAAERGDLRAIERIYSDDFVIWHNNDNVEKDKPANLAMLAAAFDRLIVRRYTNRRLHAFAGGFVQQHDFVASRQDGEVVVMPAVVVGKVANGRITRLDEYFEGAALARLRRAG